VLVTLQGTDPLQSLQLTVTLPSGTVTKSYGALNLPQTVIVELPDVTETVTVIADAVTTSGTAEGGSGSVPSQPHRQVALTLTLSTSGGDAGTDAGGDGGVAPAWHPITTANAGGARHSARMVYDSAHQQIVMFGGVDNTFATLGGTFTWDGTTWTKHTISGPGPRRGYGLTYDTQRHVVVMFGGGNNNAGAQDTNEVWEWDGASNAWNNKTPSAGAAPTPVFATTIAYHAARGRTVVFSGYSPSQKLNPPDTWEWDGTSWFLQSPTTKPPPDNSGSMVYDSARQVVVYLSGRTASGPVIDVWEYDANGQWTKKVVTGIVPQRRRNPAVAYDPLRGVTVLFGGMDATALTDYADTWEWNGTQWNPRIMTGMVPGARRSAGIAYDEARAQLVLFGGSSGKNGGTKDSGPATYFGDTWALY
jgi:hypothetical protein